MRNSAMSLLIIIGAAIVIGFNGLSWAQPPNITVDLKFDKPYYLNGQPVGARVVVTNNSGGDVYISKGFSAKDYISEMRVIDPAGRLILAEHTEPHEEFPDAPPLPFCLKNNVPVQVASYEVLPAGWSKTSQTLDLRNYYPLKLPGSYSFQVQLSAMTWNPAQVVQECVGGDINDYRSLGVFTSQTKYVYMGGSTRIIPVPQQWAISWKNDYDSYPRPELSVVIVPEEGKTVEEYNFDHIILNNVPATKVWKQYSYAYNRDYIRAFFVRKDAINSLGPVTINKKYAVVISGTMSGGGFFGGAAPVQIVNY